jgi:hypothetical protein
MLADANNMFFVVEVTEKARFIVRDDQPGSGKKALLGLGRCIGDKQLLSVLMVKVRQLPW